jgi:hypothetical protein
MSTNATGMFSVRSVTLNAASTAVQTSTIEIPAGAEIIGFQWDNRVAWDSATTAVGTIGSAAAGTQYVTSCNAKTAGAVAAEAGTAAQSLLKAPSTSDRLVYVTITPTGATTVGQSRVSVLFTGGGA